MREVVNGVCYSPLNGAFVSPGGPGAGALAQQYMSGPELRALVKLIGPYGVDAMDR